jgi:tetratricopeptide (TPR) repeat protein
MSAPTFQTDRLQGLTPRVQRLARRIQQWIQQGEHEHAVPLLDEAMTEFPKHPELLRLCGLIEQREGRLVPAIALFSSAARSWPQDGLVESNLGAALAQSGNIDAALRSFERATELDPTLIDAWFNLGRALDLRGDATGAHAAFSAVLELNPRHHAARILRAEALKTLGQIAEAESELRTVLREDRGAVSAWVALVNLKPFHADTADRVAIEQLYSGTALTPVQRSDIGFAYASLLEAEGKYAQAFDVFTAANAGKRATLRWDAAAVSALVDDILAAFATTEAVPNESERGSGVAFLVGMPRSGSTLAEQILAAHPAVAGGGETGLIAEVLQAESKRRGARFPYWVEQATDADWTRLGDEYLARIAPLRHSSALFTDKTLTNWQTLGAIRRMLPAARIVHCLRDPVETAWSCYKHNFAADQRYSYDVAELAAFHKDCARAMLAWKTRYPHWIHEHRYEDLVGDAQSSVRALLAHCGLDFDPACLRFHEAGREVRTASAAQVRSPLRGDTAVAQRYGALLEPLRQALNQP